MEFARSFHVVRAELLDRRAVDNVLVWAVNATNATRHSQDPSQDAPSPSDSQLHEALSNPWVLGVVLQSILMGIIASQVHNLYLRRALLPWKIWAVTALLVCTNAASFGAQTNTLWYFSMSSLGDIRYIILQVPPSLLVDLWLTPMTLTVCNFMQARYAYKKAWILFILAMIWLTELSSGTARMVFTTLSYHQVDFKQIMGSYISCLHLTSRLAAILGPASLRLYYAIQKHALTESQRHIIVKVLGVIFRSGILAIIPAATEAVTGLQEKRFSTAANVAYTCTPRVCTSAILASFLYTSDEKDAENMKEGSQRKLQELVVIPVPNLPSIEHIEVV